ncbi:MAG: SIMPL domain-containing protein [Hyphomicrobium sp.]
MRRWMTFQAATIAALLLAAMAPRANAEETKMQRSITVSASGMAFAEPDQARITTGVVSEAPTAREALNANTAAMQKAIAEMKAKGVDAKDIQTSSFNVEPITVYGKEGQAPRITGYRVTNQVALLVRDLKKLGEVLDHLVTAGANQASGLEFEVSKAETLKDEARKEAMVNASRRAKLLAEAGGATIGDVIQISEDVAYQGPRPFAMARAAKAESVPIEAGTSTLEARVTVTWALK